MTLTDEQKAIADHLEGTVLVLGRRGDRQDHGTDPSPLPSHRKGNPARAHTGAHVHEPRKPGTCATHVERTAHAEARLAQVRTFHSLCAWILRSEAEHLGIPADFTIYDEDDTDALIKELGVDDGADKLRYRIHAELSSAPADQISAEAYFTGSFSKSKRRTAICCRADLPRSH